MRLDELERLRDSVDRAISYVESGLPLVPMTPKEVANTPPCEFIIGDYVIYRRARNLEPTASEKPDVPEWPRQTGPV